MGKEMLCLLSTNVVESFFLELLLLVWGIYIL